MEVTSFLCFLPIKSQYLRGFFRSCVLHPALVLASCGLVLGIMTSVVAIYSTYDSMNQNCDRYSTEVACTSVKFTVCKWDAGNNKCMFSDADCSSQSASKEQCTSYSSACYWDYKESNCAHFTGMKPTPLGIYAAGITIGGTVGSFAGGPLANHYGRRTSVIGVGAVGLLGTLLEHLARVMNSYTLHVVSRVIQGFGGVVACTVGPLYADETVPREYISSVSNFFQVALTFGIALGATFGLILEPRDTFKKQTTEVRIHMFFFVQDLVCVNAILQGFFCKETPTYLRMAKMRSEKQKNRGGKNPESNTVSSMGGGTESTIKSINTSTRTCTTQSTVTDVVVNTAESDNECEHAENVQNGALAQRDLTEYKTRDLLQPFLTAAMLAVVLQFTGINAIMSYAPIITSKLGLEKLVGTFVIMLWNWLSTLISIPLASYVPLRLMFLVGMIGSTLFNLVVAIPTFPNVASAKTESAADLIAFVGILLFIFCFEAAIGPPFFALLLRLFPYSARAKGATWGNGLQMFFTLIINLFFPIAVEGFSGGPSENQKKGIAIVFFIFSAFGIVSFLYHFKFLYAFYPWDNGTGAEQEGVKTSGGMKENVEDPQKR